MSFIPTEILLLVFDNMSYWDLKINMQLVCRRFRALLTQTISDISNGCDDDAPNKQTHIFGVFPYNTFSSTNSTIYTLHPALILKEDAQAINGKCRDKLFSEKKIVPFTNDIPSLPYENATFPAVSRMALIINGRKPIFIEGANGRAVTTKDVLDRHVKLYTEDFNKEYLVEPMIFSRPQVDMRPVLGLKFTRRLKESWPSTDYWVSVEKVEMERNVLHVQFHITSL